MRLKKKIISRHEIVEWEKPLGNHAYFPPKEIGKSFKVKSEKGASKNLPSSGKNKRSN